MSKGVLYMFLSIFSFSLMHLSVKALPNIPIHEIIFFRTLFSLIAAYVVIKKEGIYLWGNNRLFLILRGVFGLAGIFCFFYSIQHMPLASAITISNLLPLFTLMLAFIFLKEKIKIFQWLLFLISFIGVYVIKGFDPRVGSFEISIAVGAAFFAAVAHFIVRKLRETENTQVIIFYLPLISIPVIGPITAFNWVTPTWQESILLLAAAIFTHIGQLFLTKSYQVEEVSKVSGIYFLGIPLAIVYGLLFFDETLSREVVAGIVLILSGSLGNVLYTAKKKKEQG